MHPNATMATLSVAPRNMTKASFVQPLRAKEIAYPTTSRGMANITRVTFRLLFACLKANMSIHLCRVAVGTRFKLSKEREHMIKTL